MLVGTAILVALAGVWTQSQSDLDVNLFRTINDLAGDMNGLARAIYALGSNLSPSSRRR
jgi:hypothetical protein